MIVVETPPTMIACEAITGGYTPLRHTHTHLNSESKFMGVCMCGDGGVRLQLGWPDDVQACFYTVA